MPRARPLPLIVITITILLPVDDGPGSTAMADLTAAGVPPSSFISRIVIFRELEHLMGDKDTLFSTFP